MAKENISRRKDTQRSAGFASLVSEDMPQAIARIRQGYRWPLAHRFQAQLRLKDQEFAAFLGVSSRTLGRRRKRGEVLDRIASDRLYRMMRIVELAREVFEDEDIGLQWLRRPQIGLGGKVPLALLDTEPGFEAVETLLKQIEYGVIA